MKYTLRILAILTLAIISQGLQAQITINTADLINVNDSIILRNDQYSGTVGDSGTNKIWAFPTLLPTAGTRSVLYTMAPSATPFGNVIGSNMAVKQDSGYTFFNRVSTGNNQGLYIKALAFDISGLGLGGPTGPALMSFTTPQPLIKTPWAYRSRHSGSSNATRLAIPFDTVISVGGVNLNIDSVGGSVSIAVKQRVNGWGTITVGTTTVPALRDVVESSLGFTIQVHTYVRIFGVKVSLGWQNFPGFGFPPQKTYQVRYWANSQRYPMIEFNVDSAETATSVTYQERTVVGLQDHLTSNRLVQIAPNPANDVLHIQLAEGLHAQQLRLVSMTGQTMINRLDNLTGAQDLDVSNLPRGTYFLMLDLGNGLTDRQRVVIR